VASSRKETITQRQIKNAFVSVGTCAHCHSKLVASASLADVIEAAGEEIHCPVCTSSFQPRIDTMQLVKALAEEYTGGDDVPEDEDYGDDDIGGEEGDEEPDFGDDEGDLDEGDEGDLDEGDEDAGMDDEEDSPETEDAVAALVASVRRSKRRAAVAFDEENDIGTDDEIQGIDGADGEDMGDEGDEVDPDFTGDDADVDAGGDEGLGDDGEGDLPAADPDMVGDDEDLAAIAFLRRRIKRRLAAAATEDAEDGDVDTEVQEAASKLRRIIRKRMAVADDLDGLGEDGIGTEPGADDIVDDGAGESPIDDDMGEDIGEDQEVVAALAKFVRNEYSRRGIKYPKSATAAEMVDPLGLENNLNSDVTMDRMDDVTPGTGEDIDGEVNLGPGGDSITPGTDFTADDGEFPPDTTIDENLHNDELSGDSLVDWRSAPIELVASKQTDDRWVVSGGRPVARLIRAKASAGVNAIWETATLETSFLHVARNGLRAADAKEFGFTPTRYRVTGTDAIRTAMRRSSELSSENAQKLASKSVERHQQALRTTLLAAIKGVVPELKNPVRDRLVADLAKLGVHESRTIVDKAFASCVDELVTGVFAYADELAAKPDAARNEAANFVAKAAFQSRDIDPSVGLSDNLVKGSRTVASTTFTSSVVAGPGTDSGDTSSRVRLALRSIGR